MKTDERANLAFAYARALETRDRIEMYRSTFRQAVKDKPPSELRVRVEWTDCSAIPGHDDLTKEISQVVAEQIDDLIGVVFQRASQRVEQAQVRLLASFPTHVLERLVK